MKHLKKVISILCCFVFLLLGAEPYAAGQLVTSDYWPEGIETGSEAAIVMEEKTGTILYQKNADEVHFPASITKIMTALIALENGNISDTVTFSKESIYNTEGSSIARDVGEEMTLEQCLYGMLLESANECAYAIAEHVGGDYDTFVSMMNQKAKELGCVNTHFTNPHGLPDDQHYTSAHDMALIAQEAWKNETFRIMTGTTRYEIPPTNKHSEITYLQNHNEMINPYKTAKYLYEYCTGGKTGYTVTAKSTLVTYAQKDGMTLICVVMYADQPYHWTDSINLFEYCFSNFGLFNVAENETQFQEDFSDGDVIKGLGGLAEIDPDASIVLPLAASFKDAESEIEEVSGEKGILGRIHYTYAGHDVGDANILLNDITSDLYPFKTILSSDADREEDGEKLLVEITPRKLIMAGVILAAGIVLLLILIRVIPKATSLRQKYYRWKNEKSPYRRVRKKGFGRRRRRRRRR